MFQKLGFILKKRTGQGIIEYTFIVSFVAIGAIAGLIVVGPKISELLTLITNTLALV